MAKVVWSARASKDLYQIAAYIHQFDPAAAIKIEEQLKVLSESLTHFPQRGRPVSRSAREIVSVRPYVMRYQIVADTVVIVRVRHGRRRPLR